MEVGAFKASATSTILSSPPVATEEAYVDFDLAWESK